MRVGWIGKESSKTNVNTGEFDLNNSKSSETCRTVPRNNVTVAVLDTVGTLLKFSQKLHLCSGPSSLCFAASSLDNN